MIADGRQIAGQMLAEIREEVHARVRALRVRAITVAPDLSTRSYLSIKRKKAQEAGMELEVVELPVSATTEECIRAVEEDGADAVIVQLPLPSHIDARAVVNAIPLAKDADVLSDEAYALFEKGEQGASIPPVACAVMEILTRYHVEVSGRTVAIVGNGKLVGKPCAVLLSQHNATVHTITRENFEHGRALLKTADIVVLGAGVAGLITSDMISQHTVLIDAGTSESAGSVKGDADPACAIVARLFTPVPGGVGPVAVACLFRNVFELR